MDMALDDLSGPLSTMDGRRTYSHLPTAFDSRPSARLPPPPSAPAPPPRDVRTKATPSIQSFASTSTTSSVERSRAADSTR